MNRRDFIIGASIASAGMALGVKCDPARQQHPPENWSIELEGDALMAVGKSGATYKELVSRFRPSQRETIIDSLETSHAGMTLDDRLTEPTRVSLNAHMDRFFPRMMQIIKEQHSDDSAGKRDYFRFSKEITPDEMIWHRERRILNCFGTALYIEEAVQREIGINHQDIWPKGGKLPEFFSFQDARFFRVENPMLGDLAVITATDSTIRRTPRHMGIVLLADNEKSTYIFNRLSCGNRVQVNTIEEYYRDYLAAEALRIPKILGFCVPMMRGTAYYRKFDNPPQRLNV